MWLQRLVDATAERVADGTYDARPADPLDPVGSLKAAIERAYPAVVAEIKPGRPGQEARTVDVAALADAYARGGACGISVLTDGDHFGGSLANLERARSAHLPLLMKDFLIDERQLEAGAAWGASAVLAIVRLHTEGYTELSLDDLVDRAHQLGLEVLAEAVTEEELDRSTAAGADVLGINVRDLDTLELDAQRPRRLLAGRAPPVPVLHLSGIATAEDVAGALKAGATGVLVGTTLMEAEDPAAKLRSLLEVPA